MEGIYARAVLIGSTLNAASLAINHMDGGGFVSFVLFLANVVVAAIAWHIISRNK